MYHLTQKLETKIVADHCRATNDVHIYDIFNGERVFEGTNYLLFCHQVTPVI